MAKLHSDINPIWYVFVIYLLCLGRYLDYFKKDILMNIFNLIWRCIAFPILMSIACFVIIFVSFGELLKKGAFMIQDLLLNIAIYSKKIGMGMIFSPVVWDVLLKGLRDGEHISICWKGVIIQILGGLILYYGREMERRLK